jgi:hypothetical protein
VWEVRFALKWCSRGRPDVDLHKHGFSVARVVRRKPLILSRAAFAAAVFALVACATTTLSGTPLEAEFAGTWSGAATFALTGRSPFPYSLALSIALSGNTATVASICPGTVETQSVRQGNMRLPTESARPTSLPVNAMGSGASASWSGMLECPRIQLLGCAGLAVTYTNATLTLTGSNQVTVVATGNAEGCGTSYPLILTFVGAK